MPPRKKQDSTDKPTSEVRYAAYDLTYERFVGAVCATEDEAQEIADACALDHQFEIREV